MDELSRKVALALTLTPITEGKASGTPKRVRAFSSTINLKIKK
ncbi:hypothetical protein [Stygiolobus caldivivus]|uniref:Uncharacterized protein n=1 Tax=Stygiolobus caldivivus TaxID=2824673 RepID=A0A8D5ZGK8_9CREN|nr:hypothetical protein [Stygiolobus caldivivus]BCU68909.1 hypothetical protein KN1_02060 [Stygiolobus caldivivus]